MEDYQFWMPKIVVHLLICLINACISFDRLVARDEVYIEDDTVDLIHSAYFEIKVSVDAMKDTLFFQFFEEILVLLNHREEIRIVFIRADVHRQHSCANDNQIGVLLQINLPIKQIRVFHN